MLLKNAIQSRISAILVANEDDLELDGANLDSYFSLYKIIPAW